MKNLFIFTLIFLIFTSILQFNILYADVQEVSSMSEFEAKVEDIYSEVNPSDITTGILYGTSFSYAGFFNYQGVDEDSISSSSIVKQIYSELYELNQSSSQMLSLDEIELNHNSYINSNDAIPISILKFKYNILDSIAYKEGLFYYDSLAYKFVPAEGSSSIPLIESDLFCGSVLKNFIIGQNISFIITDDFIFTNTDLNIDYFDVDFNDGLGFRTVNKNNKVNVVYSTTGEREICIKAHFTNSSEIFQSTFKISIFAYDQPDPHNPFLIDVEVPIQNNSSEQSGKGKGYIYYGSGHTEIVNPVIVVEGFDPVNENDKDAIFMYLSQEDLVSDLLAAGIDLIILDFGDGGDYIENNAAVLESLIDLVNTDKNSNNKNIIIGASMGGLVARYALASMEHAGKDHDTRLFISFDSPQYGANIPLSLQHFANLTDNKSGKKKIFSPAAEQMLLYHYSGTVDQVAGPSPKRVTFLNNLLSVGDFPQELPRSVSISNGSGEILDYNGGDMMLECKAKVKIPLLTRFRLNFELKAMNTSLERVFYAEFIQDIWIPPHVNLLGFPVAGKWQKSIVLPFPVEVKGDMLLDNAPGGTRFSYKEAAIGFDESTTIKWEGIEFPLGSYKIYHEEHCFIPAFSSLGIETTNAHYNVHTDPDAHEYSYFDDIYYPSDPSDNQLHMTVTEESKDWFIDEILGIEVKLSNTFDNENISGSYLRVDNLTDSVESGNTILIPTKTNQRIITNEQKLIANCVMHHHWNSDYLKHYLYNDIYIEPDVPDQDAVFIEIVNATITNSLNSTSGIQIHDPWYQDASGNQPDDFRPLSEVAPDGIHEIFRNQEYNLPPEYQVPHYSVKADENFTTQEHNSEEVKWYFQNWYSPDAGADIDNASALQTDVVFRPEGDELIANYKGHLASSNSRATGYNNGRRMARDANGKLHLVYEDNGNIWYTSSANGGASWINEELIGDPDTDDETFPAITFYDNKLFVTWIENWGDLCMIWFREKDLATGGDWSAIEDVWEFNTDENQKKPTASIAVLRRNGYPEYSVIIAYDFYESGPYVEDGYKIKMLKKDSDEQIFYPLDFEQFGYRPSLSADTYHSIPNQQIGLSYDNEGKIYFRQCNSDLLWTDPEQVSQDEAWKENERKSCLSMMNGHAHIVWEGKNIETGKWEIFYRDYRGPLNTTDDTGPKYIINPGPTVTSPIYYDVTNPTVGVNEYQEVAIFYSKNGSIYKKKLLGDDWIREYFDSGNYPALVAHQLSGAAWTKYTSAPYFVRDDHNGPQSEPLDPVWHPDWTIDEKLIKYTYNFIADPPNSTDSYISIDILNVSLDNDTLQFTNKLRSDSMQITGNYLPLEIDMKVKFVNAENAMDDQEILYKVEFIDGADTLNMTNLRYHELPPAAGDTVERLFKHTTIVNMNGRTGYVQFNFRNHTPLINLILKENDNYNLVKNDHGSSLTITPEAFRLNQNYPNPFNPLTHITVELADDCQVRLEVFNIRGQRVDELMNGFRAKGIYQVYFDGSGLSSGVYLYQLKFDNGKILTKKLVLLK